LSKECQKRVVNFCDVDVKKIGKNYEYQETDERPKPLYPIVHFSNVKPPVVIAVKIRMKNIFEIFENWKSQESENKNREFFAIRF